MKKIKVFLKIVVFIVALFISNEIWQYFLIDDVDSYTRIMMKEMYEQENVDILFTGSSHCFRAVNVGMLDEMLGVNTFNTGTSLQDMDGSLVLIQEVGKTSEIQEIYLEMYYEMAMNKEYKKRTNLTSTYIISDYMKLSFNKIEYLLNASGSDYYVNSFILARRNWSSLFDWNYLIDLYQQKQEASYINYEYITNYQGKGYVGMTWTNEEGELFSESPYEEIQDDIFSDDYLESIYEIINYCEENNIKLTLFTTPMTDFRLVSVGNYDSYIEQVYELIEGYDIEYYDFNLCRLEYLSLDDADFYDDNHLNIYGGSKFTELLGKIIAGEIKSDAVFYDSYEEKILDYELEYFGTEITEEESICYLTPVVVGELDIYYIVYMDDESYVIEDDDNNEYSFEIPELYDDEIVFEVWSNEELIGEFNY